MLKIFTLSFFVKTSIFQIMTILDFSSESEDKQQIIPYNVYYDPNYVEDDVSPGLLSCLCFLCMTLGLFALFEYHYQIYYVNVNNNTNDSFLRNKTNNSLI